MMMKVNLLPERLRGAAARQKPRKLGNESTSAIPASEAPGMDDQFGGLAKAVQMASPPAVAALAAEAAASAARAAHPAPALFARGEMDLELFLVLAMEHSIALDSDSVIHRGHGGGSPRPMSPFFDQEPFSFAPYSPPV